MNRMRPGVLDKLFVGTLLVIFGGIVIHAPLTVGFSTLWPDASLVIKSWKEILLGLALVLAVIAITRQKRWNLFKTNLFYCIAAFALLNVLLTPLYYTGFEATIAGLFINLRYFLFFVLVYAALKLYPQTYRLFLTVFVAGALVVIIFSVLQATILPHDILKYLGYSEATIMPYLTVDQNMEYIRINGTLRGPNPLGAYAVIVLVISVVAWLSRAQTAGRNEKVILGILGLGSVIALWATYSRSAALAAVIAVAVVFLITYGRRITKAVWIGLVVAALVVGGGFIALRDTQLVSQVILHEDPEEGNTVNSNDGHLESLIDGSQRLLRQPLGAGIGSTGSASLLTDESVIIENQYLFVAHETGWIGLGLFLTITYLVLVALWKRRVQWLALGVFASGIGLAIAAMVLPVWVDDTVAIIWWGLAAIALAIPTVQVKRKRATT